MILPPPIIAANLGAPVAAAGQWSRLCPYGRFETSSLASQGKIQVVTRSYCEAMVRHFRSVRGQLAHLWRGLPIYAGHPDVDRALFPNEERLGKVIGLEAREDGLYWQPAWNAKGEVNRREGYLVYPSAVFLCLPGPGRDIYPDRLHSVGLTNNPNIPGTDPVTANAALAAMREDVTSQINRAKRIQRQSKPNH